MQVNSALREQLEEAHQTNEALTNDLQKLTNDWEQMREEMLCKEEEWKEEEQYFNEYYTTEHNRLLNLWRDVVAVKRMFCEMQSATQRDRNKMQGEISAAARDMTSACSGIQTRAAISAYSGEAQLQKSQTVQENVELKSQLTNLRAEHDTVVAQVRQKEDKIQQLMKDLHNLEERCNQAESGVLQINHLQEEVELLQGALRDIAHAVLQDAENRDTDSAQPSPHVHLSQTPAVPPSWNWN
ncbi:rootletin-like isoform X2 [Lycorma delicatula]|uniref:rootletin-like isoform X2 n=1 Tax=Lycorma delicatula TaxID=130591 RepID=UPI003F516318